MSFTIQTTTKAEDAAVFIAQSILNKLKSGVAVLFFVTGGSSITVGAKVAEILRNESSQDLLSKLTILLTDERYGPMGHADSNWQQLTEKGFSLPGAKLIPILTGDDLLATTEKFNEILGLEFEKSKESQYRMGLFGIGPDGHTAGILPASDAVGAEVLAYGYKTPTFARITITPKAIEKLDEAVVFVQGQNKWDVVKNLDQDIEINKMPAQILKKVPVLTIFTDYKKI